MRAILAVSALIAIGGLLFALWPHNPRPPSPPGRVFAYAGEHVTTEDGKVICTISRDLLTTDIVTARGWCTDWSVSPPLPHTIIDMHSGWIKPSPRGGLLLHVEGSWRP